MKARYLKQTTFERERLLKSSSNLCAAQFFNNDIVDEWICIEQIHDPDLTAGQIFAQAAAVDECGIRAAIGSLATGAAPRESVKSPASAIFPSPTPQSLRKWRREIFEGSSIPKT